MNKTLEQEHLSPLGNNIILRRRKKESIRLNIYIEDYQTLNTAKFFKTLFKVCHLPS